jgi:tRNA threonylcarbamoyladenosine biosynthesis protein TsaE
MQSPSEWIEAGLQEHFVRQEPSICIVEWPEKASGTLPLMDLCIEITANNSIGQENEHHRSVTFEAKTSTGKALLKNLVLAHQNQVPHS